MRLFTNDQLNQLIEQGQPHNRSKDWYPAAKLILPGTPCSWLLSEVRLGHQRPFGYGICDYGTGLIHAGHIDLTELEWMADPINQDHVRADEAFTAIYPISIYLTAARMFGAITDDVGALHEAQEYEYSCNATPASFQPCRPQKLIP